MSDDSETLGGMIFFGQSNQEDTVDVGSATELLGGDPSVFQHQITWLSLIQADGQTPLAAPPVPPSKPQSFGVFTPLTLPSGISVQDVLTIVALLPTAANTPNVAPADSPLPADLIALCASQANYGTSNSGLIVNWQFARNDSFTVS